MERKEITASYVKRLMMRNYVLLHKGLISAEQATKEVALLANILKAIQVAEKTEPRTEAEEHFVIALPNERGKLVIK